MGWRKKKLLEDVDIAPYWQFLAIVDKDVQPIEIAFNMMIRLYTDPVWRNWFPPFNSNCRSMVRSLSDIYLKEKLNLSPSQIKKGFPTLEEVKENNNEYLKYDWFMEKLEKLENMTGGDLSKLDDLALE